VDLWDLACPVKINPSEVITEELINKIKDLLDKIEELNLKSHNKSQFKNPLKRSPFNL